MPRPSGCLVLLGALFLADLPPSGAAPAREASPAARSGPSDELRGLDLLFPVPEVSPSAMRDSFQDRRGRRRHHAVDILAPRNSAVVSAVDGTISRLTSGGTAGIAIYQFSSDRRFCLLYAHLEGYAPGLSEGQRVARGQVIGYVGSTGNAPPQTPHLHFAVARAPKDGRWWGGKPLNPYPVWR